MNLRNLSENVQRLHLLPPPALCHQFHRLKTSETLISLALELPRGLPSGERLQQLLLEPLAAILTEACLISITQQHVATSSGNAIASSTPW